jgi:hypothetical protein
LPRTIASGWTRHGIPRSPQDASSTNRRTSETKFVATNATMKKELLSTLSQFSSREHITRPAHHGNPRPRNSLYHAYCIPQGPPQMQPRNILHTATASSKIHGQYTCASAQTEKKHRNAGPGTSRYCTHMRNVFLRYIFKPTCPSWRHIGVKNLLRKCL